MFFGLEAGGIVRGEAILAPNVAVPSVVLWDHPSLAVFVQVRALISSTGPCGCIW